MKKKSFNSLLRNFPCIAGIANLDGFRTPLFDICCMKLTKIKDLLTAETCFQKKIKATHILFCGTETGHIITFAIRLNDDDFEAIPLSIIDNKLSRIIDIIDCLDYESVQSVAVLSAEGTLTMISVLDQVVLSCNERIFAPNSKNLTKHPNNPFLYIATEDPDTIRIVNSVSNKTELLLSGFSSNIDFLTEEGNNYVATFNDGSFSILTTDTIPPTCLLLAFPAAPKAKARVSKNKDLVIIFMDNSWYLSDGATRFFLEETDDKIENIAWRTLDTFQVEFKDKLIIYKVDGETKNKLCDIMPSNMIKLTSKTPYQNSSFCSNESGMGEYSCPTLDVVKQCTVAKKNQFCYVYEEGLYITTQKKSAVTIEYKGSEKEVTFESLFNGDVISRIFNINHQYITLNTQGSIIDDNGYESYKHEGAYLLDLCGSKLVSFSSDLTIKIYPDNKIIKPLSEKIINVVKQNDISVYSGAYSFIVFNKGNLTGVYSGNERISGFQIYKGNIIGTTNSGEKLLWNQRGFIVSRVNRILPNQNNDQKEHIRKVFLNAINVDCILLDLKKTLELPVFDHYTNMFWNNYINHSFNYVACGANESVSIIFNGIKNPFDISPLASSIHTIIGPLTASLIQSEDKEIQFRMESQIYQSFYHFCKPSVFILTYWANSDYDSLRESTRINSTMIMEIADESTILAEMEKINVPCMDKRILLPILFICIKKFPQTAEKLKNRFIDIRIVTAKYPELINDMKPCFNEIAPHIGGREKYFNDMLKKTKNKEELEVALNELAKSNIDAFFNAAINSNNTLQYLQSFILSLRSLELDIAEEIVIKIIKIGKAKSLLAPLIEQTKFLYLAKNNVYFVNDDGKFSIISLKDGSVSSQTITFTGKFVTCSPSEDWALVIGIRESQWIPLTKENIKKFREGKKFKLPDKFHPIKAVWKKDKAVVSLIDEEEKNNTYSAPSIGFFSAMLSK